MKKMAQIQAQIFCDNFCTDVLTYCNDVILVNNRDIESWYLLTLINILKDQHASLKLVKKDDVFSEYEIITI